MAAVPTSTIKGWFENADKPTQQQFWDWLDSMRNTLVPIPAGDISGLQSVIDDRINQVGGGGGGTSIYTPVSVGVSGANTYALGAEVLAKDFIVIPLVVGGKIDIGTTVGGEEEISFVAGSTDPVFLGLPNFSLTARTLHFTGQFQVRFITADYGS